MSSSEPGRKIKLTDIAQRAGVSVASVSRYINQPDLLSMELRSKIEMRSSNPKNILLKPSGNYMFMDGEKFEDFVKLIGRDAPLGSTFINDPEARFRRPNKIIQSLQFY